MSKDSYGDGNVYRGQRSRDSVVKTITLAQQEQEPVAKYCCHLCFNKSGQLFLDRMILCPECGNKRCPKATHHELLCTNSNEPNQTRSVYTTPPQPDHEAIAAIKEALAQPEQIPPSAYSNTHQPEQEPVVGTKTWFEDGKVVTQYLYPSDIYTTPPQRKPLSDYVNSAGINANDSPHIVLEKLERAIESEVKGLNNA